MWGTQYRNFLKIPHNFHVFAQYTYCQDINSFNKKVLKTSAAYNLCFSYENSAHLQWEHIDCVSTYKRKEFKMLRHLLQNFTREIYKTQK
jgi:hypothetical protein